MARFRGTLQPDDAQFGSYNADSFIGTATDDIFYASYGDDRIQGKQGNDRLNGGADVDTIFGGRGNDTLNGEEGYGNRLEGGTGNDFLYSGSLNGNWSELVGGKGADTFFANVDEYDTLLESGLRGWTDIKDFRAGEGDKLQLGLYLAPGVDLDSAQTLAFFDSTGDGRIDDTDNAAAWDGRALLVSTETATLVLWNVDHIDSSMLIA